MYTHHQCPNNVFIGLTARHLVDNNPATAWLEHTKGGTVLLGKDRPVYGDLTQQDILTVTKQVLTDWVAEFGVCEPADRMVYVDKFTGGKRNKLVESMNRSAECGELNAGLKGFVKCDKYTFDLACTKAPRMIQYADPAVNVELAQHLGPVEHRYLMGKGSGPTGTPDCSKGMTTQLRASSWLRKRNAFRDPVCLLGDFSKFDSHVHTHTLALEHDFWEMASHIDRKYLDKQLVNKVSSGGIKWRAVGTRMSGTYNTGGGNSVINIMIMRTISRVTGISVEMLCDGDDSLVFMNGSDVDTFSDACSNIIPKVYGMKWEFDLAKHPSEEEYCHSALSYSADGAPVCIVDPIRALTKLACVVNKEGGRVLASQLVSSLVGVYCSYPNHPVLSRVSHSMLRLIGAIDSSGLVVGKWALPEDAYLREKFITSTKDHWTVQGKELKLPLSFLDVDEGTRSDVQLSFGVDVSMQLYMEECFVEELVLNPSMKFRKQKLGDVKERLELLLTNDHISPTSL